MSVTAQASERPGLVRWLVDWWRELRFRQGAVRELACCSPEDVERIAHDAGVSGAELRILAGKWPDPPVTALLAERGGSVRTKQA